MRVTQQAKVLEYLKEGNSITNWDAFRLFNATRLSDIIFNLRRKGYSVITMMEKTEEGTLYARYVMESSEE